MTKDVGSGSDRPVAVVDIGSGSAKLLVVDRDGLAESGTELVHRGSKVSLIAGDQHRISASALEATASAFELFAEEMAPHEPTDLAVVGTAWARTVNNLDALEKLVEDKLSTKLEVLSGHREAELSFRGATSGRDIAGPVAVIDLGAGSTEFAISAAIDTGDEPVDIRTISLPIGGRNIVDQFLLSDPPTAAELSSALSMVELHLDDLRREIPSFGPSVDAGTVIGVGAIRQISEVEIGLADPDSESVDGYRLEKAALEEVFRALATESAAERAFNPGLRPQDVDDIVGPMCILVEFMRQFTVPELVVSERSLMHGLAAELLAKR